MQKNRIAALRDFISQVILVFLAMLLITSGIWGSPTSLAYRHLFLGGMMILALMKKPFSKKHDALSNVVDFVLATLVLLIVIYVLSDINAYQLRVGALTRMDVITGSIYMVILLELARRVAGMPMVVIAVFFFAQNCFAQNLPGIFRRANISYTSMLDFVFMRTDGIFGMPVQVISTYVVLFMMFAALLEVSGAGSFFIDFATSITGKSRGGPAKAAVVSSAAFGTISGSAIANVAGTGSITIPLMKKIGYDSTFAGAVEAVASTGGQIMPPVMGAVAFILAQNINMKYIEVAGRAVLPAVLYFACVFFVVDFRAKRLNLKGTPPEDIPNLARTLKNGWQLVVPLVILVYLLAIGRSAQYSALMAIVALIPVASCRKWTRMDGRRILQGLLNGVSDSVGVAITAAAAGIIIGGVTNTGLNLLFANQVVKLSGGNMFVTLLLVAIVCLVLGMGMTTSAVYISVATIMAPALIKLGIDPLCAHLFVLYYGCICVITPPVALASFTAAGISGASPSKTGWTSFRIGLVAFIVPFIFAYQPVMLLYGSIPDILLCAATSLVGCWCIAAMIEGWFSVRLNGAERVGFGLGGVLLMIPGLVTDGVGLAVVAVSYLLQRRRLVKGGE
jgi:TRAP transporter 4TM/12TM fusion protein